MCDSNHIQTIECILPPHMLEAIGMRGDKKMIKMVEDLRRDAESYREDRVKAAPASSYIAAPVLAVATNPKIKRKVYDGQKRAGLPGKLVRDEGDPSSTDQTVNEAYDGAGDVYDLYQKQFRRDSLDGNGMELISTVHHRRGYNNAFWNGRQMAYGDGDGVVFTKMTELSIIGHELSHGVVQHSGGLVYRDESGALNESFADVFGALTVQFKLKQKASDAEWLIGGEILGPNIKGDALRSMKAPGEAYDDQLLGKDPQPYHMDFFVNTSSDNGGVHINSGIPNHAFYLLAQYLGGCAWEKAGHIWYDTMQAINNPNATFNDWADKTVEMARSRYGIGSREAIYTRRAWKLVGIAV
jgi:Zn-dependent metalloprotease